MLLPETRTVMSCLVSARFKKSVSRLAGADQAGAVSRDRSEGTAGAENAFPSIICLSRRRRTEDGVGIPSRYFATVRRAKSNPALRHSFNDVVSRQVPRALFLAVSFL